MSRLLAVVLLLPALSTAVWAAAPFAAQEASVRAAAQSCAEDICKKAPPSCGEAKNLLGDYIAALQAATRCDAGSCKLAEITSQAKALGGLDRREASLPLPPGGRSDRPLLTLSSIVSSRLTSAATRLGQPFATVGYGADDLTEKQKAVEGVCVDVPVSCGEMRGLLDTEASLTVELGKCASTKCPIARVDGLIEKGRIAVSDYFAIRTTVNILSVFSAVRAAHDKGIALYTPLADQAVADLEVGTDALAGMLDRAEKDASAPIGEIDASGRDLFEKQRVAALAADRLAYHLHYDPKTGSPARSEKINAVEAKLAGLRGRALALRAARGLGEDNGDAGAVAPTGAAGMTAAKTPLPLSAHLKTIIDKRLVPDPTPVMGSAPPILPGDRA